jgi:hypothetical protein
MAVFIAFSDETSVGDAQGDFFVGGYVANEVDWPQVARAWQERVLNGPPKIPYLHMREIRNAEWCEEHGIPHEDAQRRISEACQILEDFRDSAAVISRILQADLNEVFINRYKKRRYVPTGLNEPDYFCFVAYAPLITAQAYNQWPNVERIDFVVDRKRGVTHHLAEFKEDIKQGIAPELGALIGDLIPASMEDRLPLQCADVLLWHIQRYFASDQDQEKMVPIDRLRLAELTREGDLDGTVHSWERSELEAMARKWIENGQMPDVSE